jgi:hypothetical protein
MVAKQKKKRINKAAKVLLVFSRVIYVHLQSVGLILYREVYPSFKQAKMAKNAEVSLQIQEK